MPPPPALSLHGPHWVPGHCWPYPRGLTMKSTHPPGGHQGLQVQATHQPFPSTVPMFRQRLQKPGRWGEAWRSSWAGLAWVPPSGLSTGSLRLSAGGRGGEGQARWPLQGTPPQTPPHGERLWVSSAPGLRLPQVSTFTKHRSQALLGRYFPRECKHTETPVRGSGV